MGRLAQWSLELGRVGRCGLLGAGLTCEVRGNVEKNMRRGEVESLEIHRRIVGRLRLDPLPVLEKDLEFLSEMVRHGMLDAGIMLQWIAKLPERAVESRDLRMRWARLS